MTALEGAIDTDFALACLKAVADEKRLRILTLLASGERCVCDLQEDLDAGQSLLSFHLKVLKDAGLVTDRKEGRWSYYALRREALEDVENLVRALRMTKEISSRTARCCE